MSQRAQQNTGIREVRDAHRFDEQQLLDFLTSNVDGFRGPLSVVLRVTVVGGQAVAEQHPGEVDLGRHLFQPTGFRRSSPKKHSPSR